MKQKSVFMAVCLLLAALLLQLTGCAGRLPLSTDPSKSPVVKMAAVDLMANVKPAAGAPETISPADAGQAADFALRLFKAEAERDQNTLLSPLSVLSALSMTANGARGETLRQMEQVLGMDTERLNHFFKSYIASLPNSERCKLLLANSVWFTDQERFTVSDEFLQTNADWYGAELYRAPFDESTLTDINQWVKVKTDGMIPAMLDNIPDAAVMYLINALAFDAKWAEPYYADAVHEAEFTTERGEVRPITAMYGSENAYLEGEGFTGFMKYYDGDRYAFAALLPKEGTSVDELIERLDNSALTELLAAPQRELVYTMLPKFELDYSTELSGLLEQLGMPLAFSGDADFSGLGSSTNGNIFINRVLHKTFISVDENGTRAGAATVVEMADAAAPAEPKEVYLDRPFVYLLVDCETTLPFFLGVMRDPAA